MQKPLLVAVDTNFPLMVVEEDDVALDALDVIHKRAGANEIVVTPTALDELFFQSECSTDEKLRELASRALVKLREGWCFRPAQITSTQEAIAAEAARRILVRRLLPPDESNDANIIAESAVLNAILLVSNDSHLLDADHRLLALIFREMDLPVPLIVSPRELVRKFYR